MRLQVVLPTVEPKEISVPLACVYADGVSKHVQMHQPVEKALRDTMHTHLQVPRYRCLTCGRTFRVYPTGVSPAQTAERVKGLAVMLYRLGLSYGAVSLALQSLGVSLSTTAVYEAVQAAARRIPDLKREQVFGGVKTPALGGDGTSVKWAGQWLHLGISVAALSGLSLSIDEVGAADATTLKEWMEPIAKSVGAHVLVTDDAEAWKTVADELALQHHVCQSPVQRKTLDLSHELGPQVAADEDGSLTACGVDPRQAEADLVRLGERIVSRMPQEVGPVQEMHQRYLNATPPRKGERASLASR